MRDPRTVTPEEMNAAFPVRFRRVDWGPRNMRGQGRRRGGMIMGAMSDAPHGVKSHPDWSATYGLSAEDADEVYGMAGWDQVHYRRARTAGGDHDQAMLYVYERQQ